MDDPASLTLEGIDLSYGSEATMWIHTGAVTTSHLTAFDTCLVWAPPRPVGSVPLDLAFAPSSRSVVDGIRTASFTADCGPDVAIAGFTGVAKAGFPDTILPDALFWTGGSSFSIETFEPGAPGNHSWIMKVHVVNGPDYGVYGSVSALCDDGGFMTPIADQPSTSVVVPAGKSASTSVSCPAGSLLTNGGWDVPDGQGVIVTQSSPAAVSDPSPGLVTSWQVSGVNIDPVDHRLYARAVCMTIDPSYIPPTPVLPTPPTATLASTATPTATPTPPKLSLSVPQTTAYCLNGQYPLISVKNAGGGTLHWRGTTDDPTNVALSPPSGFLGPGVAQPVTVSGSHSGATLTVRFTSDGGDAEAVFTCQ